MKLKGYQLIRNNFKKTLMYFVLILLTTNTYGQVVINEINYRSVAIQENTEFVELYNAGNTAVNIGNWQLTDGITYQFPAGTTLNAGSYIVVCGDPATCQSKFSFSGARGPFTGGLSNSGDEVVLRDASFNVIDEVDYESWKEWPNVRFNDYESTEAVPFRPSGTDYTETVNNKEAVSIQKINPNLDGKHGGAWGAATPSPGSQNSGYQSNHTNIPVIKSVSKSPDKPMSGEEVRVKADFDNDSLYADILNVELEYQAMNAGNYIARSDGAYQNNWISIPMLDDGMGADSTANNGVYTAVIPTNIQQHRTLVRYRVKVTTTNGFDKTYPDQNHKESNYAYYIYDGDADFAGCSFANLNEMQNITIITKQSITNQYIGNQSTDTIGYFDRVYKDNDYLGEGTLIYNGKIYDHIGFRPRGKSRWFRVKPGIKFDLNSEKEIEVVDDYGKKYDVERGKLVLSGTWVNDAASHGLVESLVYKILELTGGVHKYTDYTSLRIVDSSTEAGNNGDFWGIYLIQEDYNGDLLKEHKLPDGNIWTTYDPVGAPRFIYPDSYGDFPGAQSQQPWINSPTGQAYRPQPDISTLTKEVFYGDWIANEFWANGEANYYGKHSYREYYNPLTNKWIGWCKDYDGAFGSGNNVRAVSTTATANADFIIRQPLIMPEDLEIEYQGYLRSAYDLLLNVEQSEYLVDSELAKIYDPNAACDWVALDQSRWGKNDNLWGLSYPEGSAAAHFNFYKTWFQNRAGYLANDSDQGILDGDIPNKPSITLIGSPALDDLAFSNSPFTDPNNSSFAALEWRVGEWSDPTNPEYLPTEEPIYEITPLWESGEINSFSSSYTIPDVGLKVGHTYKVRVRYKDGSDRWSHWSDPVTFIAEEPQNTATPNIVINEIMYNTDGTCGNEYLEIKNAESTTVSLDRYQFTNGIDFDFPTGASIPAGATLVLARDSVEFVQRYGFSPYGDYKGSLDNNGEKITLRGAFRAIVDTVRYNDAGAWDVLPDGDGPSLELLDVTLDNSLPQSWFRSDDVCGTPAADNSRTCASTNDLIVINEINYNSDDGTNPGDWVELYNPGASAVDISNWEFYDGDGIFVIPAGTSIGADQYLVLVESASMFAGTFLNLTANDYLGDLPFTLSGKGERISLFNENKCLVDYVPFDDKLPWPEEPDGDGPTLSLISTNSDNALAQSWESSGDFGSANGTPGRENVPCLQSNVILPTSVCTGIPARLKVDIVQDDMTYFWQFPGANPPFATADSAQVVWSTPGLKTVQLITTYEECTRIQNYQIDITCTVSDTYTTPEDVAVNATVSNIVAGSPPTLISDVANGTLTFNPDGSFNYVPDADYYGPDQFIYETCTVGTPADTVIYITPKSFVGQVAASTDDAEEEPAGTMYFNSTDLEFMIDNNRGAQNAVGIRITNVDVPQGAVITNAYLEFVADEADTISTSLTINAEAIGNAPAFGSAANTISAKQRTTSTVAWNSLPEWVIASTYNSPDITTVIQELTDRSDWTNGNAMTFIIEGSGQRVAESFDGSTLLAPKLFINYESVDSITITPSTGTCLTSIVEIDVTPVNDQPVAVDDTQTIVEDVTLDNMVLTNDSDIENDVLTVNTTPVVSPANGSLALNADGTYTYTPNADFNGTDIFEYEVCDNGSPIACDTASVTITVDAVNDTPVTADDNYTMDEDGGMLSDNVLLNDSDIENNTLTITMPPVVSPANGVLIMNANGDFDYTPNANFNGTDYFQYEVCDDGTPVECQTAIVTITINAINDAPIAVDDNKSTPEEASAVGNALSNDINVDGDNLQANITLVTLPTNGTASILQGGSYFYTPDTDFIGTDTFEYEVCDDGNPVLCDTATITITVDNVNDMPIAVADTIHVFANSMAQVNVLANDTDIENDSLYITTVPSVAPMGGTLNMWTNGDIEYTPEPDYTGTITFSYEVCDNGMPAQCTTAEVVVIVELDCIDIQLFAWLEGPYNTATFDMNNTLNETRRILPGQTPVGLANPTPAGQPYNVAPWNYTGTEGATWTDADYVPDMVDWVLVSIRTDVAKSTEIVRTAALINKDGSMTFPDRCAFTPVQGVDSVYAVVEHRNHIGIMTPEPIEIVNGVLTYDFRTSDSFKDPTSFGQKQLSTGEWAMYTGDCDQADFPSFDINGTDKAVWVIDNGIFDEYLYSDLNMDGDVNGADKSLWFDNNGISSRVPK